MTTSTANPVQTFACPLCDVFPYDTPADLGEHVAAEHATQTGPPKPAVPVLTGSGRFETVDNGFGGTTTRRIAPTVRNADGATEKQIAYALSLAESRVALDDQGRDDDGKSVADVLVPCYDGDLATNLYSKLSRREISKIIDLYRSYPKIGSRPSSSTETPASTSQTLSAGMYRVDDRIYKVQAARTTGNLYAKLLDGTTETGFTFEYEQGAIRTVRDRGVRLTTDEAAEFGRRTGTCCVCAAVLTDPKSIAAGIGPICGGRI